jgi:hypothetical protein
VEIIDGLDLRVDQATEILREETQHAKVVEKTGQVFFAYMCIAIEVLVIIILIFVAFVK